jgi:hypothetical protein
MANSVVLVNKSEEYDFDDYIAQGGDDVFTIIL